MAVFDLYSKRRKAERGGAPDVYTYDTIPSGLRVQIVHIWGDAIGNPAMGDYEGHVKSIYQQIVEILRREYQVFALTKETHNPLDNRYAYDELCNFFLRENDAERALDIIELTTTIIDIFTRKFEYRYLQNSVEIADEAINELNARFLEHGIGYEYSDGKIIRIDNQVTHAEIVKPALQVLRGKPYANAQKEFLNAHENYRHGKYAEALVDCNKSFESTMKIICAKRKWAVSPNATASELIKECIANGLIPTFWQTHFNGLRSVLESGIPTARNRLGGHGAGATQSQPIPPGLAAYVLHLTASTILFLSDAERNLP
jgi:hypothetical protein